MDNTEKTLQLPKKTFLFVGMLFALVGIAVLIGALVFTTSHVSKLNSFKRVQATVVEWQYKGTSDNGNSMYSEVVEYSVDGKTYTAVNNSSSNSPNRIGSKMEIAYNPEHPEEYIFVSSNTILIIVLFAIGVLFPLAGISLVVKYVKDYRGFKRAQAEMYDDGQDCNEEESSEADA